MSSALSISIGQGSDKGRKAVNQDFHGACIPGEPQLSAKGIVVAIADGIGSSDVSQVASAAAVRGLLEDYYCTADAWSVKRSGQRVLTAINSWLYAQTRRSQYRFEKDRGYACTLSVLVLKSTTAHIFHVGDTRIYRLQGSSLELLTTDHRVSLSSEQHYLSRALGINPQVEIDYQSFAIKPGEVYVLATDGVYEHVEAAVIAAAIRTHEHDLDGAARTVIDAAMHAGSPDNLTIQIVRIEVLPGQDSEEIQRQRAGLALPPILDARMEFDGYIILRELHGSSRSHIYLAIDNETGQRVALKTPSIDRQNDGAYLDRFLVEEWVARRLNNAHILKPCTPTRPRNFLYVAMEFVDGKTLAQWLIDHPKPDLEAVRNIVAQIANGLQAFHRLEMLHQDLRPDNIMIDSAGTVKIIDFGSVRIAGWIDDAAAPRAEILGAIQYTAPEYFVGEGGSERSDLFALGVLSYQMLTGRLPYGTQVAKIRTKAAQRQLQYASALDEQREIPAWLDGVLKKAVHPNPQKRYDTLSEFVYDLRHPNRAFLNQTRAPLLERNPVLFWKSLALILAAVVAVLLNMIRAMS